MNLNDVQDHHQLSFKSSYQLIENIALGEEGQDKVRILARALHLKS